MKEKEVYQMYHAFEDNKLYNFTDGIQTEVNLTSDGEPIDIIEFLDECSTWMEKHPQVIRERYLPFSCVAVGLPPIQSSAFLYGCFVGRIMEKKKILVNTKESIIDKNSLKDKVKESINQQISWFKNLHKQIDTIEKKDKVDNDET